MKPIFCISLAVIGILWPFSSALRCWRCENARSAGECIETGRSQICRRTEKVCQTELRFSNGWGSRPKIRTGCKEQHACGNNHIQNPRSAWMPTQCNSGVANSVCRCCCNTNGCNERELLCESMFRKDEGPPAEAVCSGRPKAPVNGRARCQRSRYPGSRCTYICDRGYLLVGNNAVVCRRVGDDAFWSGSLPICRKLPVCEPINAPRGGRMRCSGDTRIGSYCVFSCGERFEMEGASAITCLQTTRGPEWSEEPPICSVAKCDDVGEIPHGNVNCSTNNNILGTTCSFDCGNSGLFLTPTGSETSRCVWRYGRAQWNRPKPCCSGVVCPPTAKKDIVIAIDSSGSIKSDEWERMKNFVIRVLARFHISPNNVEIAMFRFNREIDTDSQILFGDHSNYESLVAAIEEMPKNGGGTYIGQALRYARDYVLKQSNRPDVSDMLWVLTDGKSNDEFRRTARQLRADGVEIIALGISRRQKDAMFMEQLTDLTGDRDLVIEVSDVINSFEDDLVQLATSKICQINCSK